MKLKSLVKKAGLAVYSRWLLTPPSFSDIPEGTKRIVCGADGIRVLTGTSNNVIRVTLEDRIGFFRECRRHTAPEAYVRALLDEYYGELRPEDAADRAAVEKSLADRRRFRRFFRMGVTNDKASPVTQFLRNGNAGIIGLIPADAAQTERLKRMVQYIWGELYVYGLNAGLRRGEFQTYNAVRELATAAAAQVLGLNGYIPTTEYAVLCPEGGRERFGTWMEAAPGTCMKRDPAETRKAVVSPELQHALNNLNVLDVICHEKDHKPSNYHVLVNEETGKAQSICAFDNDSPMCFGLGGASFPTYMNCTPWVNPDTCRVNRPYMDRALAQTLLALEEDGLDRALSPYLNRRQRTFLRRRLQTVKRAVEKTAAERPGFLLEQDGWNADTVAQELEAGTAYGRTYLRLFTEDLHLPYQPWISSEDAS